MSERVGQTYDGVISGVTEWGLYVELNENKCEGMIPMRDLDDDYYEFDEKNYCLRGRRKNHTYSLGDAITVNMPISCAVQPNGNWHIGILAHWHII